MSATASNGTAKVIEIHQIWEEGFANGRPSRRVYIAGGPEIDIDDRYPNAEEANAFLDGVKWAMEEIYGQQVSTVDWDITPDSFDWGEDEPQAGRTIAA